MVLNHFQFFKKQYKSAASRNIFHFRSKWTLGSHYRFTKNLSIKKKNNSGRNDSGRIIAKTKTSFLSKLKFININYKLRYLRMFTIVSFLFVPFKNRVLSLLFFNNGAVLFSLASNSNVLFSFFYFYSSLSKKLKKFKIKSLFLMLFQLKKLTFVSCVELLPGLGGQYVRSPGTKARIIKHDKSNHTVLIELPSKIKKIFSFYSFAMQDAITLKMHKKTLNGKFGYWRSFGVKPSVRGVAMNAVDHPNGGRTKSLKYSKTPWGKTTKFK